MTHRFRLPIQLIILSAMMAIILVGCSISQSNDVGEIEPITSDKVRVASAATSEHISELVDGNTEFAFDLFKTATAGGKDGNLIFSPYSVSIALGMTYAGAKGETAEEMANTLHFTPLGEELHAAFNALDAHHKTLQNEDYELEFSIANRIWGQDGYQFLEPFLDTLAEQYGAGMYPVDYVNDTEGARQLINKWVEQQTNEKIKNLIPDGVLSSLTRLVLTNAIYLKAQWQHQFEEQDTFVEPFIVADGTAVDVDMMHILEHYRYQESTDFQSIILPYSPGSIEMVFILPNQELAEFENLLTPDIITEIDANSMYTYVKLGIPKFEIDTELGLKNLLIEMGMVKAFDHDFADFSGMTEKPELFISDVLQKAFIGVDEKGTEAAAATAVIMTLESAMNPEDAVEMKLDHPFLFFIRDTETKSILFMGRVADPSVNE